MQSSIVSRTKTQRDSSRPASPLVVFAGGGSGGHLFPALAIAERLAEVDPNAEALFLCSQRRIDRDILSEAGVPFVPLPAQPLAWRPIPAAMIRFASGWRNSVRRAMSEVRIRSDQQRPVVFALMGGFVAAPAARAARKLGRPSVLVNLDVAPGKANRLIARMATRIVSAVPCPDFPRFDRHIVGMPIRRSAIASDPPAACRRRLGLEPEMQTLLVTGASQGAGTFNRLIMDLARRHPETFHGWQVLHLTGELEFEEVQQAHLGAAIKGKVMPFCTDMAAAWGSADLSLSRCGASSVAEALANRVPTLFSPYPWHRDQHQRLNAIGYVRSGFAWMIDDAIDPEENLATMGQRLRELMGDRSARQSVRQRLAEQPACDAALDLATLLCTEARRP